MTIIQPGRLTAIVLLLLFYYPVLSQQGTDRLYSTKVDEEVSRWMKEGKIPGLSLIMIRDGRTVIKCYGFSDLSAGKPVNPRTLFQLGSCSKAFTALAVQQLIRAGSLRQDALVSDYLPWFRVKYGDSVVKISLTQLLHHTSGISWQSLSVIPVSDAPDALEQTVRRAAEMPLRYLPGKKYEYATVNYDILALIIQTVTGQPFESFLQKNVLDSLHLSHTTIGTPYDSSLLATGYKTGFFRPRAYSAPVYKGNNAAGYVLSDAGDMARWLEFQLGTGMDSTLFSLAKVTHQRDETVPLHGMSSYAMGWEVSLNGNGEIYHDGLNPNYTSYVTFQPHKGIGVVVLANSNSGYTKLTGDRIMRWISGEDMPVKIDQPDESDLAFSTICIILTLYMLVAGVFLFLLLRDIARRRRIYTGPFLIRMIRPLLSLLLLLPFAAGIYLLPAAMAGFSWAAMFVWTPVSFAVMTGLLVIAVTVTWLAYCIGRVFPEKDRLRSSVPGILLVSILSGLSNMAVILLVTSALNSDVKLKYLVFYYILVLSVYLLGNRFVQSSLIRLTRNIIYELRMKVIEKIFSTSYQQFEKMDRGRVYTALNGDVEMLGGSADQLILLVTNVFTAAGAFIYLASIAFWTTVLTFSLILFITTIYFFISRNTRGYFEKARDTQNVFMRLVNGMIDGFKEISLHRNKKLEYKEDLALVAKEYKEKISAAGIRFTNVFLVGESSLTLLLGVVVFAIPKLFPEVQTGTIMSFVIVLLYLIGPVNAILRSIPSIVQVKVAWRRLQQFLKDIPATIDLQAQRATTLPFVESFRAAGIRFKYERETMQDGFEVGPIDLEIKKGEIVFIIGGNGSGKTTFAQLVTGLYQPEAGQLLINDIPVLPSQISEYFSVVFSPAHLFSKLYNIDTAVKQEEIDKYLLLLDLEKKVTISGKDYSTINLSGGQRKRLALLQCYLEDSPIYLFDEWAADQDPAYRNFFYRTLLPEMRQSGKIVIAITHDDHYFDVADKVFKMKEGRLDPYIGEYSLHEKLIF